jgi:hypothetical protein
MTWLPRSRVSGGEWTVFVVPPPNSVPVHAALDEGWLCFERLDEVRRLVPIPPNWESASESELRSMLARAKPIRDTPP